MRPLRWLADWFLRLIRPAVKTHSLDEPSLVSHRTGGDRSALVFVHGFLGSTTGTWDAFIAILKGDPRLADWDIYSVGYASSLTVDNSAWMSDPALGLCARGLSTKLRHAPLDGYKAVAIVAHSMGGLVAQRSVLDDDALRSRLSHLVLYGTPSRGLRKAALGYLLKPQARDMVEGGSFITGLRARWAERIGASPGFVFKAVAGESDAFVPAESSIDPFPLDQQEAVPGNHLEIVRPNSTEHPSYKLLFRALVDPTALRGDVESARLAVERQEFRKAVDLLLPGAAGLDPDAVVTLSLALESLGRGAEALEVLERHCAGGTTSMDALGVLAGRVKRRWQVRRQQADYDRASELYGRGLDLAEVAGDHAQAYYHAINIAFLMLTYGPPEAAVGDDVRAMAQRAEAHAGQASETAWSLATMGEARLILGQLDAAVDLYCRAISRANTLRDRNSMYAQAILVAGRAHGDAGITAIEGVFGRGTSA